MKQEFVHLHVHKDMNSNLLMLDSTITNKKLIKKLSELGFTACASTGHDGIQDHVQHWKLCKENNIKPIIGYEAYFTPDRKIKDSNSKKYFHLLLLAKNDIGLENLQILSTKAWLEGFYSRARIDWETLEQYSEGLICADACDGGIIKSWLHYIFHLKEENKSTIEASKETNSVIKRFINIFGKENYYLELQPNTTPQVNQTLIKMAKYYDLKTIITTDAHYLRPEDKILHGILLKSNINNEREQEGFYDYTYLMTTDELKEIMIPQIGETELKKAFQNTLEIAEQIEEYTIKHETLMPEIKFPEFKIQDYLQDYYYSYEYINNFRYSSDKYDQYWFYLIEQGFVKHKINQKSNIKEYIERINTELGVLWKIKEVTNKHFAPYFCVVVTIFDIIRQCNSLISCGRGSVGGFLTCYLADITQIDPIELDLPYWRFLHESRPDNPDIDFDSEKNKKQAIQKAIEEYFGVDKVIHICTFGTISSRSALLSSARGLGIDHKLAEKYSSLVPVDRGKNRPLDKCIFGDEEEDFDPIPELASAYKKHKEWFDYAIALNGIIDKRSAHASGKIIYPSPYTKFNAAMTTSKGIVVTQLNMEDSEFRGGIKYDFLVTELQDKLHYCLDLIKKDPDYIHYNNLDFNNKTIWENIFHVGNTDEVFQWATDVGKNALKKLKPNTLKELSAGNSLIRLMSGEGEPLIDKYIRYKENPEQAIIEMKEAGLNDDEIEIIQKVLKVKYNIAVSQEDIMILSNEVAGFNIEEQNKLRKMVAKKKSDMMDEVIKIYYDKAKDLDRREIFIDFTWNLIMALKGYGFSDIHSDEYTIEGMKSAKLKYHHPLEWQCACLNVNANSIDENAESNKTSDYTKIGKAISEFKQSGGVVYPPDINKSWYEFTVNDGRILYGLKGLVSVGDDVVKQIINNRPYTNFKEFYEKNCWQGTQENVNYISRPTIMSLIKAGAFDFYNDNRLEAMKEYIELARMGKKEKREILDFSKHEYSTMSKKDYETMLEVLNNYNKGQWEFDAMNFFFSETPFDCLKEMNIKTYDSNQLPQNMEIIIFGTYVGKEDKPDKKYCYLVTATGTLKTRVYLDKWTKFKDLFTRGTSLIVKGVYRYGALTLYDMKEYYQWKRSVTK